jgi:hypothetical protein
MSAPVREPDDGPSKDGPSNYAPKKIRRPKPDPIPAGGDGKGDPISQNTAPESGQPPWKRSKQRGSFAGDLRLWSCATSLRWHPTGFQPHRHASRPARNTDWRAGSQVSLW